MATPKGSYKYERASVYPLMFFPLSKMSTTTRLYYVVYIPLGLAAYYVYAGYRSQRAAVKAVNALPNSASLPRVCFYSEESADWYYLQLVGGPIPS